MPRQSRSATALCLVCMFVSRLLYLYGYGGCCRLAYWLCLYLRGLRVVGSLLSGNAKASTRGTTTVDFHAFFMLLPIVAT